MQRKGRTTHHRSLEPQDPEVLNADGAATSLGVSARLVLRLARTGKLPGKKVGKEWRFRRSALLAWLGKVDQPPEWLRPLIESGRVEIAPKKKR